MDRISLDTYSKFRITDSTTISGAPVTVINGPLSFTEVISKKGYRYKQGFWETVLGRSIVQDTIASRRMLGMIEHPIEDSDYLSTPYEKAASLVLNVDLKQGVPYGSLALLNNEQGNSIKALADLGVPIGVSTRGLGTYETDDRSQHIPAETFGLITWDFTRNPNLEGADLRAKVADSFMETRCFKEFVEAHGIATTHENHPPSDILKEMLQIKDSLTKLINKLQ